MAVSKTTQWFKDNVVENEKELLEIGALACNALENKLSILLGNPMTAITIYAKIFDTMTSVVADKEAEWESFVLNVADRFKIGYTTTNNDDDEKAGNFMIALEHVENTQTDDSLDDDDEVETCTLCAQWNAANVKVQPEVIKEISAKAKVALGELINIKLESSEYIIPMFCIIHAQIINYIRLKRTEKELTDYEINVAGLYTVGVTETDEAEENIYFVPSISLKLKFKNDAKATGTHE